MDRISGMRTLYTIYDQVGEQKKWAIKFENMNQAYQYHGPLISNPWDRTTLAMKILLNIQSMMK